jgi:tripartite-type tricarboxylate transporter receptor subunit TctC
MARRDVARDLALALAAAAVALTAAGACPAQTYPTRPIRVIVPYTAGSPNDVIVRLLAQRLEPKLGQPLVMDNRPGGGTAIGTKAAANAEPDGYTLLFSSSSIVIEPALNKAVNYDPQKDFAPIATVATTVWCWRSRRGCRRKRSPSSSPGRSRTPARSISASPRAPPRSWSAPGSGG